MKKILMLATGGTIACRPMEDGSLAPAITSRELLDFVPELAEICEIETCQLFNIDSTNMGPAQWKDIVMAIKENMGSYDGFVITHGTDTMAYTAAALSYMIQNPMCPIVITGSQKSIYNRDTDARGNLLKAFTYASYDGAWGVQIVFDNKVILGTRARKVRSKSFNAFESIDYPEIAVFNDTRLIPFIPRPMLSNSMRIYTAMDPSIFVLRLFPGIRADIFNYLEQMHCRAVIIEGFGVGGLPNYNESALMRALEDWSAKGNITVFSTQVQHEGSDLGVYEVGRLAKEMPGIWEARTMTPEALVTKLMWVLARTDNREEAERLFHTPVQFDIL